MKLTAEYSPPSMSISVAPQQFDPTTGTPVARAYVEVEPHIEIEQTDYGAVVTVTDAQGSTQVTIYNGQQGERGLPGSDGRDGRDGQNGQDGFSPIATVVKSGETSTITITDANGTTTATVSDGTTDYNDLINKPTIPTATSDLVNDSGFITTVPVSSVNAKTGAVALDADDVGAIAKPSYPAADQILVYNQSEGAWVNGDLNQALSSVGAAYYVIEPDEHEQGYYHIDCNVEVLAEEIGSCRKVFIAYAHGEDTCLCDIIGFNSNTGTLRLKGLFAGINLMYFTFTPDLTYGGLKGQKTELYLDDFMMESSQKRVAAIVEVNGTTIITNLEGDPITFQDLLNAFMSSRDIEIGVPYGGINEADVCKIIHYDIMTSTLKASYLSAYNDVVMTFQESNGVMVMTDVSLRPMYSIADPETKSDGDFLVYDGTDGIWEAKTVPTLPSVSASDNGKFLRVVNGSWSAVTVPNASGNSFGS